MGITHLFLLSSSPINYFPINPRKPILNPNFHPQFRPSSSSRPNHSTISDAIRTGRFNFDDDLRREKRRNWWSDDEEDDDDEFVFWEESNPIDWVSKVLSMFGWMIPAVIISSLLGTGTNSFVMALVVPLGQTALSLVIDRIAGNPSSRSSSSRRYKSRPKPRSRSRKRSNVDNPSVGTAYGGNQRNAEARSRTSSEREGYQSWRTTNNSSNKSGESGSRFGGWDELDEQVGSSSSLSREGQSREVNGLRREDSGSGKLSRTRNRDKPLFIRLLIAVFPLLGSWTRFLL